MRRPVAPAVPRYARVARTLAGMYSSPNSRSTGDDMSTSGNPVPCSYDDFLEAVIIRHTWTRGSWRMGQTAFNTLQALRPELAEKYRGSDIDPFYADLQEGGPEKVATFLAHVREDWDAVFSPRL